MTPSNYSQTLTNFTLKRPSKPLGFTISHSLQRTLREREGKEDGNFSIFQSSLLCNGLRVISSLQLCPQFIFQVNYENDLKIWLLKLFLQK